MSKMYLEVFWKNFDKFAAKGPVNRLTSQRIAHKAYKVIEPVLLEEEKREITIAIDHAFTEGSREEFDDVMLRLRKRLLGTTERK